MGEYRKSTMPSNHRSQVVGLSLDRRSVVRQLGPGTRRGQAGMRYSMSLGSRVTALYQPGVR